MPVLVQIPKPALLKGVGMSPGGGQAGGGPGYGSRGASVEFEGPSGYGGGGGGMPEGGGSQYMGGVCPLHACTYCTMYCMPVVTSHHLRQHEI